VNTLHVPRVREWRLRKTCGLILLVAVLFYGGLIYAVRHVLQ